MNLKDAISACSDFAYHKDPARYLHCLRGVRTAEGIELSASDGFNAMRVLVPHADIAQQCAHLPDAWTLAGPGAKAIADAGQLTIGTASDGGWYATTLANVTKSGKPGKAKPGPRLRDLTDDPEHAASWCSFDVHLTAVDAALTLQATVSRAELLAALEPLSADTDVILEPRCMELQLTTRAGWSTHVERCLDPQSCAALPIRLSVAHLWNALGHMTEPEVRISWAATPADIGPGAYHEGGPARLDCGDVRFVTMPMRETGLIVKQT